MTETIPLICPVCGQPLARNGGSYLCPSRHTFDIARSGYVNLTTGSSRKESGDSKDMAAARSAFLDGGSYAPFRDALLRAVGNVSLLVDAGCGEGYYTAAAAKEARAVLGIDLSRPSVDRAAKRAAAAGIAEKTRFAVASVYTIPVEDGCADAILSVFAPCAEEEFLRVLRPGGRLILGSAGPRHLRGLKEFLYSEVRDNTDRADLPKRMTLISQSNVQYSFRLDGGETIRALYGMTPYAFRTPPEAEKRLYAVETLTTPADFEIRIYEKPDR